MIIGFSGSRTLEDRQLRILGNIGKLIADLGHELSCGAACGADQAIAAGCLGQGGSVLLWLPWRRYERPWYRKMGDLHPGRIFPLALSRAHVKLQKAAAASLRMLPNGFESDNARMHQSCNYLIVQPAWKLVAWPGHAGKGGGVRQAIRVAQSLDRPVLDLFGQMVTQRLIEEFLDAE